MRQMFLLFVAFLALCSAAFACNCEVNLPLDPFEFVFFGASNETFHKYLKTTKICLLLINLFIKHKENVNFEALLGLGIRGIWTVVSLLLLIDCLRLFIFYTKDI